MQRLIVFCALYLLLSPAVADPLVTVTRGAAIVKTTCYEARLESGSLVYLRDLATGEVLLSGKPRPPLVRFVERNAPVTATAAKASDFRARRTAKGAVEFAGAVRSGDARANVRLVFTVTENEIVVTGGAEGAGKFEGLASVVFRLSATSPHTKVIAPVTGGNSFPSGGLRSPQTFEWPVSWEAAMVQVQGRKGGLLAYTTDGFDSFKDLEMTPDGSGMQLALESENSAPFEGRKRVASLTWRIRPYSGEWRKGAGVYRDWLRQTFRSDVGDEPAWVKDIRAEIHVDMNPATLDALVKASIDPTQTLLYVPDWRTNGYDRNYPNYTPSEKLAPFVERAHALGFRVMLHVNYFGCDPKMPEYERFSAQQMRHKYSGDLQWWDWPRADPPIKFAYINPASAEWRKLFVGRMTELVRATGADALHLDQTLCVFNDKNGLMGGLNSAEGNLLLHKELKAALPQVALSGEGLDEVTMIYEAFAQRHVMGVDHVNHTFDRAALKRSHPISAYLFGDRTKPYMYLGSGNPGSDQFHQAWRDAYRHWGVLPGYGWPSVAELDRPAPGQAQALDEVRAHQKHRLDPRMDGPWPANVNFPYSSASGETFAYVTRPDGWTLSRTDAAFRPVRDYLRTITGVSSVELPGTIPGALCYDDRAISGLDPRRYYVYQPEPRDMDAFHLEPSDTAMRIESGFAGPSVILARARTDSTFLDSPAIAEMARARYEAPDGRRVPLSGEVSEKTGSTVQTRGFGLFMHPPWKGSLSGNHEPGGSFGATVASFDVKPPEKRKATFEAQCKVDDFAAGKSDGVIFTATAVRGKQRAASSAHALPAASSPLKLDLSPFAGKRVTIDVAATAGPKNDPSYDWGLIENPRVTVSSEASRCRVVWPKGAAHRVAPGYAKLDPNAPGKDQIKLEPGGAVMATSMEPTKVNSTTKLSSLPQCNQTVPASGAKEEEPIQLGAYSSGGVERQCFFSHPPDGGSRLLHYFVQVPSGSAAALVTAAGIKDGSKSEGVTFEVWRSGEVLWSKHIVPANGWQPVEVDLGTSTGEPMMIALATDSEGNYYYDWALWAEPELVIR